MRGAQSEPPRAAAVRAASGAAAGGAAGGKFDSLAAALYIDLLKRAVCNIIYEDPLRAACATRRLTRGRARAALADRFAVRWWRRSAVSYGKARRDGPREVIPMHGFDLKLRLAGDDYVTMVRDMPRASRGTRSSLLCVLAALAAPLMHPSPARARARRHTR